MPVDEILARLKEAFPQFDPTEQFPLVETSEGSIEFSWSDQRFRFDIRGICGDCQKLLDVMREFSCPMYDPQLGKRYDAENGTAVGETPKFRDATPEEKAARERLLQESLAKFSVKLDKKKGCGAAALLMCVCAFALAEGLRRLFA